MLMWYLDFPSLFLILLLTIPMLFATGLFCDFLRGFSIAVSRKKEYTMIEMKRALLALHTTMKLVSCIAILVTIVTIVLILVTLDTPEALGPNMAVACLVPLYAVMIDVILLIFHAKVKTRLIEKE